MEPDSPHGIPPSSTCIALMSNSTYTGDTPTSEDGADAFCRLGKIRGGDGEVWINEKRLPRSPERPGARRPGTRATSITQHMTLEVVRVKVVVSGIPRGYHFPRPDGNWLQKRHREQIESVSEAIRLVEIPPERVRDADLDGTEVVLAEGGNRTHYPGELDYEDYQQLFVPSLKWVQLCSTGFGDNVNRHILDGSVVLTNAPGLHTHAIAESVLAAMLEHAKRFRLRRLDQAERAWRQRRGDELLEKTVLIVGLGRIGRRVAGLCSAFGMRVIGTRRRMESLQGVDVIFAPGDLVQYIPEADYLVMAAPLTPETENMLDDAEFEAMKESAYLVNVGRGGTVRESAMLSALREGRIAGAYLDVFVQEPLPSDHELWGMDNVFINPHDSHSSPRIGDRMVDIFCGNLEHYVRGEPLENVCDPAFGY